MGIVSQGATYDSFCQIGSHIEFDIDVQTSQLAVQNHVKGVTNDEVFVFT